MALDLTEKIKRSIQESTLRLIAENNKTLLNPNELIRSLQSHAEGLNAEVSHLLAGESDFGPSEDEAIYEVIRDFFYRFDFKRVIFSTNQASLQQLASQVKNENFEAFRKRQTMFRKFCESGDIPDFDCLAEESEAFVKGSRKSDEFIFLKYFDSNSPRLVGSTHLPKDLIGTSQIEIESTFLKIRPKWLSFLTLIFDYLSEVEESENLEFAENFQNSLIENGISKTDFRSLYQVERLFYLKHKTLNTTKVRGGIADLMGLMKVVCQSRFQHLYFDAWESLEEVFDKKLMSHLKDVEWLQQFDPFTFLLTAPNVSLKIANDIGDYAQDAIGYSEDLLSDFHADLEHLLKRSGWIVENDSMSLDSSTLVETGKINELAYQRNFAEANIGNKTYFFRTEMQRAVLRWLIEEPGPHAEANLCQRLKAGFPKSTGQFKSLRDSVFKNGSDKNKQHEAWGELIFQKDKKVYLATKASEISRRSQSK
jgi:hypothetical protein